MTSENAIVGFAQGLLLVLFGQEQGRPGVFVVGQTDPEDVILGVEGPFYQVIQVVGFSSGDPCWPLMSFIEVLQFSEIIFFSL